MASDVRMLCPSQTTKPPVEAELSDGELLRQFVDHWDHAAFCDLVGRHGPMVLGVCRRILRDAHAAEDAFQATFLLLVRKARSLRKRDSVGSWLYGAAHRIALEARGALLRRQVPVCSTVELTGAEDDGHDLERDELYAIIHEELGRLPEKYRAPLVLCYIEELSHEAVARQLGWPLGTVRGRVARGRDLLGTRLLRRGVAPAAVLLALSLLSKTSAAVSVRLIEATARAATHVAAGEIVPRGEVSAGVVNLERKVRMAMRLTGLKWTTLIALNFVLAGAGAVLLLPKLFAADDDAPNVVTELKKLQGAWVVVSAVEGGVQGKRAGERRLLIDRKTFMLMDGGEVVLKGPFKLDPSKDPIEMDIKFEEGKMKGKTGLAIYAFDGVNLKFCGVEHLYERPKDFTSAPGDSRTLLVLKRAKP